MPEVSAQPVWQDRHLWQIQPVRDVLLGLAIVGVFLIGYKASIVTVPMLLALLLAYLFEPVINWLVVVRGWFSRQGAVAFLIGFIVFILVVPVAFGAVLAVTQGARFISQIATTTEDVLQVVRLSNETRSVLPMIEFSRQKSYLNNGRYLLLIERDEESITTIETQIKEATEKLDKSEEDQQKAKQLLEQSTQPPAGTGEDTSQTEQLSERELDKLRSELETYDAVVAQQRRELLDLEYNLKKAIAMAGRFDTNGGDPKPVVLETEDDKLRDTIPKLRETFSRLPGIVQSGCLFVMNRDAVGHISDFDRVRQYGVFETALNWIKNNADAIASRAVGSGVDAAATLLRTATSLGKLLFALFLTAFFFFFISTGYPEVLKFGRSLLPDKNETRVVDLISQMDNVVAGFVRGRLIIALIQSVLFSIAYALIGVPMPIVLGVIVGFLSMIPYVALVGIPASVIGLGIAAGDHTGFRAAWWWVVIAPVIVYLVLQAFDDYILTPKIQGQSTGMDTPTILFASLAGGALFGVYGLLIAIPIAACVKILLKEVFWPRFQAWTEGEVQDFLPIGTK
ncbi:MAG: AI-2E family transporter [Phycisphaeraceae bacterium]|nr:AI-2E family transporter [Phycisphaerales bacterium]MCB9859088.1 AI-2E family transporter [Phycisphaeraceae bacterium]